MDEMNREGAIPVLLREDLDDIGKMGHRNCSPDIIVQHKELYNPLLQLRECYDRDISEDRSGGRKEDYIYVRCRNKSEKTLENIYIHLFRNHLGLYNRPEDWQQSKMHTKIGQPAKIEKLAPDEIGVAPVFLYDHATEGWHPNCFVAVASFQENPDFSHIDTLDKYIEWVNLPNVAARNVSVQSPSDGYVQWSIEMKNPGEGEGIYYIIAEVRSGSKAVEMPYGFRNSYLNINRSQIYRQDDQNTHILIHKVGLPKDYKGELEVWCKDAGKGISLAVSLAKRIPMTSSLKKYAVSLKERVGDGVETDDGQGGDLMIGDCILAVRRE